MENISFNKHDLKDLLVFAKNNDKKGAFNWLKEANMLAFLCPENISFLVKYLLKNKVPLQSALSIISFPTNKRKDYIL